MPSDGTRSPDDSGHPSRYETVSELARGGMAVLSLARVRGPSGFTKYVVLKRIAAKWADEQELVEMFLDEARLAATLDHPNVVHVYDAGRDDEGPFFAMEYIHGEDLRRVLGAQARRETPLDLRHVLTIGLGAAAGLHHAHEKRDYDGRALGIIHRDVSPSNVIVTYEGGVKLVDFGIAKASTSRHATRPSIRKGKIAYMSPEQCKGAPIDRRSDVFSLGIVLHELCTGRRLFASESEFAVMNAIVNHDAIAPSKLRPDLPEELERIIVRALRRDPDERQPDARAVQRELEHFAEDAGITPSATALGEHLEDLFGERPYPWESPKPGQSTTEPARAPVPDEIDTRVGALAPDRIADDEDDGDDVETRIAATLPTATGRRRVWPWIVAPLGAGAVAWGLIVTAPRATDDRARPEPTATASPDREPVTERSPVEVGSAPATDDSDPDAPAPDPDAVSSSTGAADDAALVPADATVTSGDDMSSSETSPEPTSAPSPRKRPRARPRPTTTEPTPAGPRAPFDPDGPAPRRRDAP